MEKSHCKKNWQSVCGPVLGLILLAWLLLKTDLESTKTLLLQTNLLFFALGGVAYLVSNLARAFRFIYLGHLPKSKTKRMFLIVLATSLANQVLPVRLGELAYIYLARRTRDMSIAQGFFSILVARLFDLLTLGLLFSVAAVPQLNRLPANTVVYLWIATGSVILVTGLLLVIVIWHQRLGNMVVKLIQTPYLSWIPGQSKLFEIVNGIQINLKMVASPLQFFRLLAMSLVAWISNFGMLYFLLTGIGISVTSNQTVIGATLAALTSILPINSIGSFGTLEVGWTAGFVLVGMDQDLALSSGFAIHILALAYAIAFGLFAWAFLLLKTNKSNRSF